MTLFVKEISSVGAVDSGDNPEADIVFWKRNANPQRVETKGSRNNMTVDLSELPVAVQEHIAELEKARDDALAALAEADVVDLTDDDPVEKAAPEVQELIAKQREELDDLRKSVAKERAERRDVEFAKRMEDDGLEALLGKSEEVGPNLRRLADADPEAFDAVYGNLVAAAQRADISKFAFGELGENKGEADPETQRDSWVAKRVADGDDRTEAELRAAFWKAHPDALAKSREGK